MKLLVNTGTLGTSEVDWDGHLNETALIVFGYGYCGNFAKVLSERCGFEIFVIWNEIGFPDHLCCKDKQGDFIDITGIINPCEDDVSLCEDILDYTEIYESKFDYLAEMVIDEFLLKHKPR